MIRYVRSDILTADVQILVNPVNCVGVMGKGLALRFARVFPDNRRAYALACSERRLAPGRLFVFETGRRGRAETIVNLPTKRHWRDPSRIEDVASGIAALAELTGKRGFASLAVPKLGCGLGGLDWPEVRPMIEAAFAALPEVFVQVHGPGPAGSPAGGHP